MGRICDPGVVGGGVERTKVVPCVDWGVALGLERKAVKNGDEGRRFRAGKSSCEGPLDGWFSKSGISDSRGGGGVLFSGGEKISWARGLDWSVVRGLEDDFGLEYDPTESLYFDDVLEECRMVPLRERKALVARERKEDLVLSSSV